MKEMSNFSKRNIPSLRGFSKASVGTYSYLDNFSEDIQPLQKALSSSEGRSRVRTLLSRGTSAPIEKKFRVVDVEKKFQQYGYTIINRLFINESLHPTHYLLSTKFGDEFILEMESVGPLFKDQVILSKEIPDLHLCKEDVSYAAAKDLCTSQAFEDKEKRVTISEIHNIDDTVVIGFKEDPRGFVYPVMKEGEMFPHVGDVIDITEKVATKVDKIILHLFHEIVKMTDKVVVPEINEFVRQINSLCEYINIQEFIDLDLTCLVERIKLLVEKEKINKELYEKRKNLRYKGDVSKLKENLIKEASNREMFNNTIQEFYNLRLNEIIDRMKSPEPFVFVPPNISQFLENTKDLL